MPEDFQGSQPGIDDPPNENVAVEPQQASPAHRSPLEVFQVFLKLGLTAFGGLIAHLGYFQRDIIERRKWISQSAYGDLVALCQIAWSQRWN